MNKLWYGDRYPSRKIRSILNPQELRGTVQNIFHDPFGEDFVPDGVGQVSGLARPLYQVSGIRKQAAGIRCLITGIYQVPGTVTRADKYFTRVTSLSLRTVLLRSRVLRTVECCRGCIPSVVGQSRKLPVEPLPTFDTRENEPVGSWHDGTRNQPNYLESNRERLNLMKTIISLIQ